MVREPDRRSGSAHGLHRGTQPALELVVIVGIQQIVLAVVLVLEHHLDRTQPALEPAPIRRDAQGTSAIPLVAPAAPVQVGLSQVIPVLPVAAIDQPLKTSAIGTRC